MITMKNYNDIDQVLKYKGDYVFVNREDIILNENEEIIDYNQTFLKKLIF